MGLAKEPSAPAQPMRGSTALLRNLPEAHASHTRVDNSLLKLRLRRIIDNDT
jgi:hypothetical protein